ncbi:MAG: nucleotide exchange factor GrpE [Deltaproteobacteria bacterium]|nr:nucleotide exchange factor GrpE [Deltaproteobacteria bacterium]
MESSTDGLENDKKLKSDKPDSSKKNEKEKSLDLLDQLKSEKESAQQEAKESYDKFLRISAEFDNYKKRSAREMDEFRKFANESLLIKLLPVVDNLERAIDLIKEKKSSKNGMAEGIELTLKEIINVLESFNVNSFESLNKTFDPNFHQAVMQEETEDVQENIVIKEFQKGYMIKNRLLRPAMVVVSKAKNNNKSDNS